jgi:hypothetical protein
VFVGPPHPNVLHLDADETPSQNVADNALFDADTIDEYHTAESGSCAFTDASTICVQVGKYRTMALLDTGAEIGLISSKFFAHLPPNAYTKLPMDRPHCYGVGGKVKLHGHIRLNVQLAGVSSTMDVYIIDGLLYPLIIGSPFLRTNKAVIDWGNNTLQIPQTFPLYTVKDVSLSPGQQVFINTTTQDSQIPIGTTCITQPTIIEDFQCVIPQLIHQVHSTHGLLPIALLNVSLKTVHIPSGTFLTRTNTQTTVPVIHKWSPPGTAPNVHRITLTKTEPDYLITPTFPGPTDDIKHLDDYVPLHHHDLDDATLGIPKSSEPKPSKTKTTSSSTTDPLAPIIPFIDDPKLTKEQVSQLQNVLNINTQAFSDSTGNPGHTDLLTARLRLIPGTKPKHIPFRASNPKFEAHIDKEVQRMLDAGIITESDDVLDEASWTSRIVAVPRKGATPDNPMLRICIDFRLLNENLLPYYDVVPNVSDTLKLVANKRPSWYTALDVRQGFYSIDIDKESQNLTGFLTRRKRYVHTRLPMGARPSPFFFQQLMHRVLTDTLYEYACCYIDDIIIFSSTFEDHLIHLDDILKRIIKAGLKLQAKKCSFAQREIAYLGHILGDNCIKPHPAKVEQLKKYPTPTNLSELRSFLGLTNFYRKFISRYAHMAKPLQELLHADVEFHWDSTIACRC